MSRTSFQMTLSAKPQSTHDRSADHLDYSWSMMGGRARVLVVGTPPGAAARAEKYGALLEAQWSRFVASSDLSRLAAAEGSAVVVAPETETLLRAMIDGWRETDRDFDPTLLPAVVAVGYGRSLVDPTRATRLPASARSRADLEAMRIDIGGVVTVPAGVALDPGGIGKGLAADLIAADLMAAGAAGCLIDIGGDVRVMGEAPDGIAWRIVIDDPFDATESRGLVRFADGGIATSSQRKRRWRTEWGTEAHHLIDPATERSVKTSIQTVTVIASTAARAEVLTKPGFVRPADEYLAWVPTRGAAALMVDADGTERTASNWSDYA